MSTRLCKTAELFLSKIKMGLINPFTLEAYAAEGADDSGDSTSNVPMINYEQLIINARKEEKDKLYPRIQKAEDELKNTTTSLNASLLECGSLKAKISKLEEELDSVKSNKEDSQEVLDLREKISALEEELEALKANGVDEATIRAKIEAEFSVKYYRDQKIAENKDNILEVFEDLVGGNTNEEVDASIENAIEKSNAVKKQLGLDVIPEEEEEIEEPVPPKKTSKKPPVGNPASKPNVKEVTVENLRSMDVRSPEYAEYRKKLGLK